MKQSSKVQTTTILLYLFDRCRGGSKDHWSTDGIIKAGEQNFPGSRVALEFNILLQPLSQRVG